MNKSAAVRSQARRATLTKVALDPAQALGYAGMLGGGALAGDAAMNGEQSALKRVGKGVLGAGLAYAGHKALTDPTAQDIIRTGTQRGMDFIRKFLGKAKAAEARTEKRALDNVGSEIAGSIMSPVTTGLTGAGIAALVAALRGKNVRRAAGGGAVLGAALGAPLLEAGGVLAGVLSKRRTRKEQQEHDSRSHWASLLPGVAAYNRTKRMGRVLAGVGEPDEQKKAAEVQLRKQAAPAFVGKLLGKGGKAVRRAGQLLSGSKLGRLENRVYDAIQRSAVGHVFPVVSDVAALDRRLKAVQTLHNREFSKVLGTWTGLTAAGTGGTIAGIKAR